MSEGPDEHARDGDNDALLRVAAADCAATRWERCHQACMRVLGRPARPAHHTEALRLLARIAIAHGNAARAEAILRRAIALNHGATAAPLHTGDATQNEPATADDEATLLLLAQALSVQRDNDAALAIASTLRWPTDALSCDTLGVVFARAGEHARALPLFDRAVALAPDNASYHYNQATALQFTGALGAAESAYAQAIACDSSWLRAYLPLTQLRSQFDASWVAALEERVADADADADAAADIAEDADAAGVAEASAAEAALLLGHALATVREKQRDPMAAMAVLHRAKRARRAALLLRDGDAHTRADALFAAAARTLQAPPAEPASSVASNAPLFVLGLPRSGTTLTERILGSHSAVHAAGELPHFSNLTKKLAGTRSSLVLDPETLLAALAIPASSLGEQYLERCHRQRGTTAHFVDKMPLNFFYAGLILRALPNARLICLRRHPLDVCLGNYRQLFSRGFGYYDYAYDLESTAHYVANFEHFARACAARLPKDRFLLFDYDELVAQQHERTTALLAFCGLPLEPACLRFQDNDAAVSTASSVQVREPMYRSASGRYRAYGDALAPARRVLEAAGVNCD